MIFLQITKLPVSTDFFIEKKTPFFKTLTFEASNETLFCKMLTFMEWRWPFKCCLFENFEYGDPFIKKREYLGKKNTLF